MKLGVHADHAEKMGRKLMEDCDELRNGQVTMEEFQRFRKRMADRHAQRLAPQQQAAPVLLKQSVAQRLAGRFTAGQLAAAFRGAGEVTPPAAPASRRAAMPDMPQPPSPRDSDAAWELYFQRQSAWLMSVSAQWKQATAEIAAWPSSSSRGGGRA